MSQNSPKPTPAPAEPGKRSGEGVESLMPHLQRQAQAQPAAKDAAKSGSKKPPASRPKQAD